MSHAAKANTWLGLAFLFIARGAMAGDDRALALLELNRSKRAAECLDATTLAAAVEAGLQRTVFVEAARADLGIRVNLDRPAQERWSAAIDLEDSHGRRLGHRELTIRAPRCASIDEALELVVSLMVDVTRESVRTLAAVPMVQTDRNLAQHAPEASSSGGWHERFFLLGSTRVGQLPGLGTGLTLAGEWGPSRAWYALVSATLWAPEQMSDAKSGAKFWLGTAEASICGSTPLRKYSDFSLCVGQEFGLLNARAFGFDANREQSTVLYDLTVRLRTAWWATAAFVLHLGMGVGLPLVQNEFFGTRTDGSTVQLMSRPLLVPLADFGIGLRLGQ